MKNDIEAEKYPELIRERNLTIYDPLEDENQDLWIPISKLDSLLKEGLVGFSTKDLPNRTRSKVVKQEVCKILGYQVPDAFKRTRPRFPGQLFDTYVQKSNNLQIWNEEISVSRRYVIIKVSNEDIITNVRVITGEELGKLDTTGTLTQKYQARLTPGQSSADLISEDDTYRIQSLLESEVNKIGDSKPTDPPTSDKLLPINIIYNRLVKLLGVSFTDSGFDQERNRGEQIHRIVCDTLGYEEYSDDGKFPDIRHQLLEVKLQTSPTIDLGLVSPDSTEFLDIKPINNTRIRNCDVRYALFYGTTDGEKVEITNFYLTTGKDFYSRFPKFGGNVVNKKLQIPLPTDFFD